MEIPLEIMGVAPSGLKRRETIWLAIKPAPLMVWGALVPKELAFCTSQKAPSMLKGVYRF